MATTKPYRVVHLNKSGSGMASQTACGRNILRTPLSTNWDDFKSLPEHQKCEKCAASKQAEVNARTDAKKDAEELAKWEPEAPDAWKTRDDAIVAAHRAA